MVNVSKFMDLLRASTLVRVNRGNIHSNKAALKNIKRLVNLLFLTQFRLRKISLLSGVKKYQHQWSATPL